LYDAGAIPPWVRDISQTQDGIFVNPYHWLLFGDGAQQHGLMALTSADSLKVIAQVPIDAGVYVEPGQFGPGQDQWFSDYCGTSDALFRSAVFRQAVHHTDPSSLFYNIPVVADVAGDAYTLTDYYWNSVFHTREEMLHIHPAIADCPCREIRFDSVRRTVSLINKGVEWGEWKKQSIGLATRHGFTYGKYTVKINMPKLLNTHGIWNGLTNAIWLLTQSGEAWNNRRACAKPGYIADYYSGKANERSATTAYSEIDFEILKTGPYCPEYVYPPVYAYPLADQKSAWLWNLPYPAGSGNSRDEIMVCCTNWDMACGQPENFDVGCGKIKKDGQVFMPHRWDHWYKAVTEKTAASDMELFGGTHYYFQIEWKPDEIIWRIGPEKDQLRVVGYMNAGMTSIPDNQMILIISQEFHSTSWWPGSPFEQGFIPFPANDLKGEILEITIE
jgi:hypothetical protein